MVARDGIEPPTPAISGFERLPVAHGSNFQDARQVVDIASLIAARVAIADRVRQRGPLIGPLRVQ